MKYISLILLAVFSITIATSCKPKSAPKKVTVVKKSDLVKKSIGVKGMTCVGCEVTLEQKISEIDGVVQVKASHTNKEAIIEFDRTKTDIIKIAAKINALGYQTFIK